MARSINDIQQTILSTKSATESLNTLEVLTDKEKSTLANLTSTSKVALWRLIVYIVAVGIWSLEKVFDVFKTEITTQIAEGKIHNFEWYINQAKNFQFGFALQADGTYNNSNTPESAIIESKIVKQVAIDQLARELLIKVAKEDGSGQLTPLEATEITAFTEYMEKKKDAGTWLNIQSRPADDLKVVYDIYYNPQIFDLNGQRLDGTSDTPVQDHVQQFTRELEFNGELILTKLTDYLQQIEGLEMPVLKSAEAKYQANPYTAIDERYTPDSGYFNLDLDNSIFNFININD